MIQGREIIQTETLKSEWRQQQVNKRGHTALNLHTIWFSNFVKAHI